MSNHLTYLGLTFQFLVVIALSLFGGYLIDVTFCTPHTIFTLILPLIAIVGYLYHLYHTLQKPPR